MSQKTDRNGNIITYNYDGLNRLTSQKTGSLEKTTEYGLTGAKVKENYGKSKLNYKYDIRGNLIYEKSSLDNCNLINEYTYDGNNFVSSFKFKNGDNQVSENTYTYTDKGQLKNVYEDGTLVAAYSYDLNGKPQKTTYGNNVITSYDYNYAGFVKSVQSKNENTVLDSHSYTYYDDGNQKTKVSNGVKTTYKYDNYGRLISETTGKNKKNYTYDLSGNRTRLNVSGDNENYVIYYTYDAYNRLRRETKNEKGSSKRDDLNYYYDYNGNQILISYDNIGYKHNENEKKFEITNRLEFLSITGKMYYNGFNELITKSNSSTFKDSFAYRPDGLLFKKESDARGIYYYNWQGNNISAIVNNDDNDVYTRGLGLIKSNQGFYYLENGHNDVSALIDENGTVLTKYAYDAFGNQIRTGERKYFDNPFRYCGEYYDDSLDGIYLRARTYNPSIGRFTTEDPVRDGMNWYTYCGNNPIMFKDPSGKIIESDGKFDSYAQRQLIYASRDYLYKKLTGDIDGANKLAKEAADFRSRQEIQSWLARVTYDPEAQYLEEFLNLAFDKANQSGFKRGSDEYAMIVTFYALQNTEIWDNAQNEYVMQLMAYGISMSSILNGQCFTGDTLIKTSDGYKEIKDIKEGDLVLSENEETGETGYKKVKNTFIRDTETLVKIYVDGNIISTTEEHPFYLENIGWINAKDLKNDDLLRLADGSTKKVLETRAEKLESPVKVYNFEVEDWHTYFVSKTGVLVHNVCGSTITTNLGKKINIAPSKNHTTITKNPGPYGTPNSSIDILGEDGNIKTRRWYDKNGHAYRDIDMTNHGNAKQHFEWPHEHSWDWSSGKPIRK